MEKQWRTALDAVNESKLQKNIDDLNNQLNEQNRIIIQLKKENQTLRLKAHMAEDDPQLELHNGLSGLSETNNLAVVSMERIKDLEKTLKAKD